MTHAAAGNGAHYGEGGGPSVRLKPTAGQLARAMEVDRRFADLDLGLVDASVVALAESLDVRRLATRDVRHFTAVRLSGGRAFELVVHPTDPDRS